MELAELFPDPYNKNFVVTICDANIATYLSGRHNVLHICFLNDLKRVPIMGLASYKYKDIWNISVTKMEDYYRPFNFGRKRIPDSLASGGIMRGDTVQVEFKFREDQVYVRIGKNRTDWTRWLCSKYDRSIKLSFIVESAKKNFVVLRDDLYLDYLMNGSPRSLRHCFCCNNYKDRVVVPDCGHYMCVECWSKWFKGKPDAACFCSKRISRQIIARLRDSPCPIDHCRFGDTEHEYVLVPCGCVVRCVNEHQGKPLRCPHEACNKAVEEKWALYEH
ncbi:unnamed protein product [Cylicocyclus nassatus]|uniref:RING-type domain-containing protein n=1 Tax=Cylicocyclus nassatus TaxID=53992 RepID=A0AA36GCH6_CYLNA|nr:unnamed protein product [Cylicocyclus nassatus]